MMTQFVSISKIACQSGKLLIICVPFNSSIFFLCTSYALHQIVNNE